MEITIDTLISIAGIFLGGGGGAFFMWRWQRRKAKAEAQTAEVNMAKEVQDIYQQALSDKDKQLEYYRRDAEEQRNRLDQMESTVRDLQNQVARNGRQIECMRPFLCADLSCKVRKRVVISAEGEVKETKKGGKGDTNAN